MSVLQEYQAVANSPATEQPLSAVPVATESSGRRLQPLIWVMIVGAIVRAGLWIAWGNWSPLINDDARDYRDLAVQLATTGAYADASGNLLSLRPPLYPMFVAATYRALGLESNDAVRAWQACLGLATTLIVYRLATLVYSRRVALWAAGLFCFYPSLLAFGNVLLSETLFIFLATAFVWLALEAVHRDRLSLLSAAGVTLGLAALTRSILLPFTPLLAVFIFVSWWGTVGKRILAAALPVAVLVAVIAPWAVRNTRVQQTLTIIDVMGGRNVMMGNYEYTPLEKSWATISSARDEHAWHRVLLRDAGNNIPQTQGQLDKLAMGHAVRFIAAHPWLTVQRDVVKFFNFWQLERTLVAAAGEGYFGDASAAARLLLAAIICGGYALVIFGAIFGICCQPPLDLRNHAFLLLSILFPCLVHTLIFAHERYHLPCIPLLSIYAAAAIAHRADIWNRRRQGAAFRVAAAICGILVLAWLRELVVVDFATALQFAGS